MAAGIGNSGPMRRCAEVSKLRKLRPYCTCLHSAAWDYRVPFHLAALRPCRVNQTRAFDTESAGSSYATGFVVDKARGILLTNRHVCTPGEPQQGRPSMAMETAQPIP